MVDFKKLNEREKKLDMIKEVIGKDDYKECTSLIGFETKIKLDNLLIKLFEHVFPLM